MIGYTIKAGRLWFTGAGPSGPAFHEKGGMFFFDKQFAESVLDECRRQASGVMSPDHFKLIEVELKVEAK